MCNEEQCIFYINFGKRNQKHFDKNGNCAHCAGSPQYINRNARKCTCFISDTEADIYHHGKHAYKAKNNKSSRPSSMVNDALAVDLTLTPSQILSNCVISALISRTSWDEVDVLIEESASLKEISNENIRLKRALEPSDGIEVVVILKKYNDIKDKFLIFKIDENDQYVFKTSSTMQFASEMNCCGDHFLHDEYIFFDRNHKRVRDYVTFMASFYYPLLQKQVVLATMQCKHENEKFNRIFSEQFNEAYKQVYITLL